MTGRIGVSRVGFEPTAIGLKVSRKRETRADRRPELAELRYVRPAVGRPGAPVWLPVGITVGITRQP